MAERTHPAGIAAPEPDPHPPAARGGAGTGAAEPIRVFPRGDAALNADGTVTGRP